MADVEPEATPQRNPLRGFIDFVGPDVPARGFLIVRRARLDRHRPVEKQPVPVVIDIGGATERLVLGDFIHGCERVLVQSERVLAVGREAERQGAVSGVAVRQPIVRPERRPRGIGPIRARGRCALRLRGRRRGLRFRLANFERRIREASHAQHVAVGLDRRHEHFTAQRRADFLDAVPRFGPAREAAVAAPPRPDVVDVAVGGHEIDLIRRIAEARRVLDRPVGEEHGRLAFGDSHERPALVAQARHDHGLALGGKPGERLAGRGTVKRALELAPRIQQDDFRLATHNADRDDTAVLERRCKAKPPAFGEPPQPPSRAEPIQIVVVVVVVADLGLREQQVPVWQGSEPRTRLDVANRFDLAAQGLAHQPGKSVAVPLHVPAISPARAKGTGDRPVVDDDLSGFVVLSAGLRRFPGEARGQPFVVFEPQLVHRLARDEPRRAVNLERKPAAAVGLDIPGDRLRAVALGEEPEEIAAVEIIPVERKPASFGVDFGKRAQTPCAFGAHHALEMALPQPPVSPVPVRLGIDREAFCHPVGFEQVRKSARKQHRERER